MKVKNLDAIIKKLNKSVEEFASNSETQEDIAQKLQLEYRKNIREGYDVNSEPFKELEKPSIARRKKLAKMGNKTSDSYAPDRSNLTFTGELVQKIFIKFGRYNGSKMFFEIDFQGTHNDYIINKKTGERSGSKPKISDLVDWLRKKGYNLYGFPSRKKESVAKTVSVLFKRYLKRK